MPAKRRRKSKILPAEDMIREGSKPLTQALQTLGEANARLFRRGLQSWREMEVGAALIDPREQMEKAHEAERQALEAEIALRSMTDPEQVF